MLDTIIDILKALYFIYETGDAVKENAQEIKRFCRHADDLMKMIQEHSKTGTDISSRTERSLRRFQRNILIIQDTVQSLKRANFVRRLIFHPSFTRQIQRAYADMSRLTQEFTLEQVIDMKAVLYRREAAKERDRRTIDNTCREILEKSNGGNDTRKLLEVMRIPPEDMEETLVSCSNRLNEDIPSQLERAVLSSVTSALDKRVEKTMAIPPEYAITSLDVVIHHHKRKGQGGFARVFEGTWQGRLVAVKVLERGLDPKVFEKEIDVWRRLNHENILKFYGACSIADTPFMVCELKRYGNINTYLADHSSADRRQLLTDACQGLEYLHQNNVIHGDLKGSNILVGDDKVACLCDFGFSRIKTFQTTLTMGADRARATGWGTMRWAAPEQLNYGGTSKEADIYSFAMTMYEIYSGSPPFVEFDVGVIYERVRMGKKPPSLLDKHRVLDRGLTAEIWRIMSLASKRKPADRPAASTVAAWLKFSNTVYNTSGDSAWDDSSEQSPTLSGDNVGENWGGNRLKKPSTASLHATAGATDSYPHKPRYSESGNRKLSHNKYQQPPKIHYHNPTHATVPRPPPGTFQPVGAPMVIPYGGPPGVFSTTHSRPGENSLVYPFGDMGAIPPGAVPVLQVDHGMMLVPDKPTRMGGTQSQPVGTFVPTGPPTMQFLAPPVPHMKKSRSKGRLGGWFSSR